MGARRRKGMFEKELMGGKERDRMKGASEG